MLEMISFTLLCIPIMLTTLLKEIRVALFFNTPFTAYPNSTWGAVTEFRSWWKHLNIKLGVL